MMISPQALSTLVRYATEKIELRPRYEQAEIYDALAAVLPSAEDRVTAARVAFAIRETESLQMDFQHKLNS